MEFSIIAMLGFLCFTCSLNNLESNE